MGRGNQTLNMQEEVDNRKHHALVIEENRKLHRREAPIYDRNHAEIFNPNEQKRLKEVLVHEVLDTVDARGIVLDVGAGTGNIALKVIAEGKKVVVCDLSLEMLQQLRGNILPTSPLLVGLVVCNAEALPFRGDSFHVVSAYSVLHHLPSVQAFVNEAGRVLERNGKAYFDHDAVTNERAFGRFAYKVLRKVFNSMQQLHWQFGSAAGDDSMEAYRSTPFPYSLPLLKDVDFRLTDGNYVGLDVISAGSDSWRSDLRVVHYFGEYGYFKSSLYRHFGWVCRHLRIGFTYFVLSK